MSVEENIRKSKFKVVALHNITENVVKALKIDFTTEKKPYNPEFVAKIKRSEAQMNQGKGVKIAIEDLWK